MIFFKNRRGIAGTVLGLLLLLLLPVVNGQVYNLRNYGIDSRIPSTFIYTVVQSDDGYLWVGTGSGLVKFDGFDFFNVEFPDSVKDRNVMTSMKDRNGTLWFGCSDGSVFYTADNVLAKLQIPNIKYIMEILEGPDGYVYVLPQGEAIYRVNPIKPSEYSRFRFARYNIFSGCFAPNGNLLIGTDYNLRICELKNDTVFTVGVIEGFDDDNLLSIKRINGTGSYIVGTRENGLFSVKVNDQADGTVTRFRGNKEMSGLKVQSIFQESDNISWISTFENGLYQIYLSQDGDSIVTTHHLDRNSGLSGNNVKLIYRDIEGNIWIGFYGDGLSLLSSYAFSFFDPGFTPEKNNIIYISKLGNKYFLGTPEGYFLFDLTTFRADKFVDLKSATGNAGIESWYLENENKIWIGTKGNGLYVTSFMGPVRKVYSTGDSGQDNINSVMVGSDRIWLATVNGITILNKKTGSLVDHYGIDNGLPHNVINSLSLNDQGEAYVACESDRLYKINPSSGVIGNEKNKMTDNFQNDIQCFSIGNDGVVWASTRGNGIFRCYPDSIISYSKSTGLKSNYCYSILVDKRNNVWIGHENGFSRLNAETGRIKVYDPQYAHDGVCNDNAIFESDGRIFIGTTKGMVIYDSMKDNKENVTPFNNINTITINGVTYPFRESFSLPYKKRYNVTITYVGIYFSDPQKVYYSTYLENYDESWTPYSTRRDQVYSLVDGKYKFQLISTTEDVLLSNDQETMYQVTPVTLEININRPFWRSWWGILTMTLLLTAIIIIIIREREETQRKAKEYLEKELELRTSVMMKQKSEIELQNLAITDSINYAKRIQTSILPDINKLKETFRDAFILFCPRDIVSGDFYWFDKIDDDIFVLVCADSTGHGVPGAFMSIIGSTLLQDIVTRQKKSKPSEILTLLDKQIFSTLNKNIDLGVSNDGMDMVVCEFNLRTRHVRFASAMRPVIIVIDGQQYYIKGNRSSVGGESFTDKFFDDQEYYLNEGDIIYMFSDGLPDQFGGTDGKKMKIARLKSLIDSISGIPMNEQEEAVLKFYNEWKGQYDQVDDVLIMGIKI
jgi:ligand-binding sensor domain-containing protein/serine phosphatase RsbU (regulator of sigma subunit)